MKHDTRTPAELSWNDLRVRCMAAESKLAEIQTVCGKYATPASVVSVHGLAKRVLGIIEERETNGIN